jgi:DNA-directed RNA polymerase subunit omega
MKHTLVQDALKVVHSPQVLVNIVSKRVRQLGQGFRPLVAYDPKLTFMDVALKEVAEGKLGFEMIALDNFIDLIKSFFDKKDPCLTF